MGIRLYYSNETERLAGKLAANLKAEGLGACPPRGASPFRPSTIIIPNKNLEQWLKMGIARRNTIATNLRFPFLEKGLWDLLASFDERAAVEKPVLLDPDTAQLLVLSELLDLSRKDAELEPLWRYLHDKKGARQADYCRKAWQLSEKLEKCFREYEYNREEMIDAWTLGKAYYKSAPAGLRKMEECQRAFYARVFGKGGSRDRYGASEKKTFLTLPHYERLIFRTHSRPPAKKLGDAVHIFGLSQISAFHTRLLFEIGSRFTINLYQLNVCSEFWEDLRTPQEARYEKFRKIKVLDDAEGHEYLEEPGRDNRLLKLWGKPGRENVKLLSDLEEACSGQVEFDADWMIGAEERPKEELTVLRAVQEHILLRIDGTKKMAQDTSIQIAGCPGIYREVETVYNSIIRAMKESPSLKLTDIAVLVPAMAKYKPAIEAVFSRDPDLIPYTMSDAAVSEESAFAQAVLSLLELVGSPFSRRQVFSLILNDCFLAAAGISRDDALTWLRWADELNIFHSFDGEDRKRRGYTPNDLYTWRLGLERLRLGRIMVGADSASEEFLRYKHIVPFSDLKSDNAGLIGSFGMAVETLIARLAPLSEGPRSCVTWAAALRAIIDECVAVPRDRPAEALVSVKVKRSLEELALCDRLFGGDPAKGVEFGIVSEYLKAAIEGISSRRGKYLAGGVTISSLLPMRPIPFRIVYIMGLGEGEFPGQADRSTLDLRHYKHRIGDVSRPEANRYLFLEMLMSVREKLYLTYVSCDTQKDELFHPCSVVNELRGYLDDHILTGPFRTLKDEFAAWRDDVPLKGSSLKYLADTGRADAWSDILANYSVPDRLSCLIDLKELKKAEGEKMKEKTLFAMEEKRRSLVTWDRSASAPASSAAAPEGKEPGKEAEKVSLSELKKFLENPIDASLRRHLAIFDDGEDEDLLGAEDEPFYSTFPVILDLRVKMLERFIDTWCAGGAAGKDPVGHSERYLEDYYEYCRLQGKTPDEVFGQLDRKKYAEMLKGRITAGNGLAAFLEKRAGATFFRNAVIGESAGIALPGAVLGSPALKVGPKGGIRPVAINGMIPFLWSDEKTGALEALVLTMKPKLHGQRLPSHILNALLFYIALRAAGFGGKSAPLTIHASCDEGIVSDWAYDIGKGEAAAYLAGLVNDVLDEESFDLLPREVVLGDDMAIDTMTDAPDRKTAALYREKLREAILMSRDDEYSSYEPEGIASVIDADVPPDAYEKVVRRLKWLCDANRHAPGKKI